MPIRRELRDLYPAHWRELSRRVRFERAHGMCQGCGRPHGATVRCLPDGRWYDSAGNTWRDRRGRIARYLLRRISVDLFLGRTAASSAAVCES
jgi:hypothetical protein